MRTLSRYFATRYLGMFAVILAVSTSTIVVIEMLLNLDDMFSADHGPGAPIQYLILRLPSYYLRELIPVTSFAASFFTLGLSAQGFEVLAAKAGGVSPDRLLGPILSASVLVAIASFAIGESWIVGSTREWNRHESGSERQISYREGSFWFHQGRRIYNVAEADLGRRTLLGVRLFDLDTSGRLTRSIDAPRVEVDDDHRWRFHQATIRHLDPYDPASGARVEHLPEVTLDVADPSEIALINTDLRSLTVGELRSHIALRNTSGDPVGRATTELHARFIEPIAVVLLALLAAPLGLQVRERNSFGIPAAIGIATVAVFFAIRSVGSTLASEGVVPAVAATGFLLLLFGALGALQLRFVPR